MAGPSNLINLDSLIRDYDHDNDEGELVFKISEETEILQPQQNDDSGSDSSYGELAKNAADDMDRMIAEVIEQQEEKTKRIAAARHEKAKELEEKQKSFGRGKNIKKIPPKNTDKIQKVQKEKSFMPNEKNTPPKDKKLKKNINLCKSVIKDVTNPYPNDVNQATSKMKNVTIQNFDIESSPSESDREESNLDLEKYNKMLSGYQKSFTVKSLNRIENEVLSSSEEDEDNGILDKNLPRFATAEKSAAAHRRKRSNYLKKRHSNYKKDDTFTLVQVTEVSDANSSDKTTQSNSKDSSNLSKNKSKNDSIMKKNQIIDETNDSKYLEKNLEQPKILKKTKKFTKVHNNDLKKNDMSTNYSPKDNTLRKNKIEKNYDNFEKRSSRKPKKPPNMMNNDSGPHSLKDNKVNKRLKNNSTSNELSKSALTNYNGVDCAHSSKDDLGHCSNDRNHLLKSVNESSYLSSDDSIQILKEVSLIENKKEQSVENDSESVFKFERSPLSSENEIDWKAVEELRSKAKEKTSVSYEDPDSDEELGNDLLSIVKKHSRLVKELSEIAKIEKPTKDLNDLSSSDLEAEFDAVLEQFDKIK